MSIKSRWSCDLRLRSQNVKGRLCPAWARRSAFAGGNGIPERFPVHEPRQMTVEADRASVTDRRRSQPADHATKNAAADGRAAIGAVQVQLHGRPREQAMPAFDERTAGR